MRPSKRAALHPAARRTISCFGVSWRAFKRGPRIHRGIHIMSESIKHISDASFDQDVTKSDKPVLLDFWAEWCGPCKMIAPILDEVAKEKAGAVKVGKVNIDENQNLSFKFNIRAIPTMLFFKN